MEKIRTPILTSEERDSAVALLLEMYTTYQKAWFSSTKRRISNQMFFADPIVWIRYKHVAYQGTVQALTSWHDLIEHSMSHDGICGKRLNWLISTAAKQGVDILSSKVISAETSLEIVATLPIIVQIADSPEAMTGWRTYEYYKHKGQVQKWSTYIKRI